MSTMAGILVAAILLCIILGIGAVVVIVRGSIKYFERRPDSTEGSNNE